jgi:hypothetical protein
VLLLLLLLACLCWRHGAGLQPVLQQVLLLINSSLRIWEPEAPAGSCIGFIVCICASQTWQNDLDEAGCVQQ